MLQALSADIYHLVQFIQKSYKIEIIVHVL